MTTSGKEQRKTDMLCRSILVNILERCDKGERITFEADLGGNTLTVMVETEAAGDHTHVGAPDGDFEGLVRSLYNALTGDGGHLSWVSQPKEGG